MTETASAIAATAAEAAYAAGEATYDEAEGKQAEHFRKIFGETA